MKADRFALLLAGLLGTVPVVLVHCGPAKGVMGTTPPDVTEAPPAPTVNAQALAGQVKGVRDRFAATRSQQTGRVLPYTPEELTELIAGTRQDLDQAIRNVQPSGTEPLLAWANDEFQQIQGKIPPPATSRSRVADATKTMLRETQQPPGPQTVPTDIANRLLDQVDELIRKIFVLADTNDLIVEVWVGSTPHQQAGFSFGPQSSGGNSYPFFIKTDGKRQVLRGLYAYKAVSSKGKKVIGQMDLVMDGPFFCCDFNNVNHGGCHNVTTKKACS